MHHAAAHPGGADVPERRSLIVRRRALRQAAGRRRVEGRPAARNCGAECEAQRGRPFIGAPERGRADVSGPRATGEGGTAELPVDERARGPVPPAKLETGDRAQARVLCRTAIFRAPRHTHDGRSDERTWRHIAHRAPPAATPVRTTPGASSPTWSAAAQPRSKSPLGAPAPTSRSALVRTGPERCERSRCRRTESPSPASRAARVMRACSSVASARSGVPAKRARPSPSARSASRESTKGPSDSATRLARRACLRHRAILRPRGGRRSRGSSARGHRRRPTSSLALPESACWRSGISAATDAEASCERPSPSSALVSPERASSALCTLHPRSSTTHWSGGSWAVQATEKGASPHQALPVWRSRLGRPVPSTRRHRSSGQGNGRASPPRESVTPCALTLKEAVVVTDQLHARKARRSGIGPHRDKLSERGSREQQEGDEEQRPHDAPSLLGDVEINVLASARDLVRGRATQRDHDLGRAVLTALGEDRVHQGPVEGRVERAAKIRHADPRVAKLDGDGQAVGRESVVRYCEGAGLSG